MMQCGELDNDRELKESHCALFLLSWLFVSSCLFCCVCFSFVHCVYVRVNAGYIMWPWIRPTCV